MILQALTEYYEALCEKGDIPVPGWTLEKVSYGLDIDMDGKPRQLYYLKTTTADGKKAVPRQMLLPARVKKTSGKRSNFLCENSQYLLGLGKPTDEGDGGKASDKAQDCFECAADLHHEILDGVDDPAARAVCAFFDNWDAAAPESLALLREQMADITAGVNIVLMVDGRFAQEYKAIKDAWQRHYDGDDEADGARMRCLVTGKSVVPELVHPAIKGLYGAQSSGASLVSFNANAFCSFGRNGEQNLNAPVGKYAAFAYTSALNYLIADSAHSVRIGDTTVVFWAKNAVREYRDLFAAGLDGNDDRITDGSLLDVMKKLASGDSIDFESVTLDPQDEFCILGLSPNAARVSVRFFLQNSFGAFMRNLETHYELINIVGDGGSKYKYLPLWLLLRETVNEKSRDKSPKPHMAADTLKAILTGTDYPSTLFQLAQLRIRADRSVTRGRAAIIKAYLLKKYRDEYEEVIKVELNESTTCAPYVLGRLFSVLENIQQSANPGINTTIRDKYFSSACATPAVVFPVLIKLAQSHLKKVDKRWRISLENKLMKLTGMLTESYPAHLDLREQGIFQLGYYHETQRRYEKKTTDTEEK